MIPKTPPRPIASAAILAAIAFVVAPSPAQTPPCEWQSEPPILPFRPPSAKSDPEELVFKQIAKRGAMGQVMNSYETFGEERLSATFAALYCTATLIGPQVLLVAAHCVDGGVNAQGQQIVKKGSIKLGKGAPRLMESCAIASTYLKAHWKVVKPRSPDDFALCQMERTVPVVAETLDLAPARVAGGERLMIAGYGCSEKSLANGRLPDSHHEYEESQRKLRVGFNRAAQELVRGYHVIAGRVGTTDAIICKGDSGGAVYAGVNLTPGADAGWRVVAVNSAVSVSDDQWYRDRNGIANHPGEGAEYYSYLSPLYYPAFADFLTTWQAENRTERKVCGFNGVSHLSERCRR